MAMDFSKAFDSMAFAIIKAVLRFFNFSVDLIDWIMIMLKDFIIEILHAGNPYRRINIGRGCRPFKIGYQIKPFKHKFIDKYMEGFSDDITLSVENSITGLESVTRIIEDFGNLSGLRINKDKTQAMIFGQKSKTATPRKT